MKIANTKNTLVSIIKTMQALFLSKIVLTKKQQQQILDEYRILVNISQMGQKTDTNIYLLTPKPVAFPCDSVSFAPDIS